LREAIELHDSKVTAIVAAGLSARVVVQAYLHRSEGEPGTSPGSGWIQEAELRLEDAQVRHPAPPALDVLDGFVEVAGRRYANLVPLPFDVVGPVRVLLDGPQGVFEASATAAQFALVGDARYVEEFPGAGTGA